MKKRQIILLFLIIFLLLGFSYSAHGLELDYPKIEEIKIGEETTLPEYVEYIFNFSLWIIGLVAFISLVIGGIRWAVSMGSPDVKKDAKNQMIAALIGIVILFFSIIIIEKINPDLLVLPDMEVVELEIENTPVKDDQPGRMLEINYPQIGNLKPVRTTFGFPEYVEYIFKFAIWGVGILVLMIIIIAGFQYLSSVENPGMKKDARDKITFALIGMLLLISSVIILEEINLELTKFSLETESTVVLGPGVWLCSEEVESFEPFMKGELILIREEREEKMREIGEKCHKSSFQENLPEGFVPEYLYIIHPEETDPTGESSIKYAAVLHEKKDHTGGCVFADEKLRFKDFTSLTVGSFRPKSVTPLILREEAKGEGVTLYSHRDFNEDVKEELAEEKGPYQETPSGTGGGHMAGTEITNMRPCYSIKIDQGEEWIAIAYQDIPGGDISGELTGGQTLKDIRNCEVFSKSNRNLEDDFVGTFCVEGLWGLVRFPCVNGLRVLKGQIMDE